MCHVEKAWYGVMVSNIPCYKACRPTTTATELFVSNQMEPIWSNLFREPNMQFHIITAAPKEQTMTN